MKICRIYYLTIITCLAIHGCTDVIDPVDEKSEFEIQLENIAEQENLPSLVVGILREGEFSHNFNYGLADKSAIKPADDETIYYLASLSKVFTAVAAMQLVEQGVLSLDEDISSYLPFEVRNPFFPETPITIRMLLGHRSSLANKNYGVYPEETAPPMYPGIEHILTAGNSRYEADIWRNVRPGSDYLYSNVTAALLGYLIEEVSGEDYNEYCKNHIFNPLGMTNTSHSLNDLFRTRFARPYVNGRAVDFYSVEFYPSGMLKSTLSDLSKFANALLYGGALEGNRILLETSVNEMLSLHNSSSPIGYIWYKYSSLGGVWGHAGWFYGYQTMMLLDPNLKRAAIILSNSSTPPNNPILFDGEITKLVKNEMFK